MTDDIALLPATELVRHFASGALSPVEATKAALARIDALNPRLNAFRTVAAAEALKSAAESEARWRRGSPLGLVDGVPTSIKDTALVKGWVTRIGSLATPADKVGAEDAPLVARLRESGAVLLGQTTTPEFGWKGVTDSPLTGISRNPWNPEKQPGGSSGGAAIAAATGMGALHIGSDGAGSIRIPASFCGVFGLKPTLGRVPHYPYGIVSLAPYTHYGPLTRTVADAALMLSVIAQPDIRDIHSLQSGFEDHRAHIDDGIAGWRVGFSDTLGHATTDPEVAAIVRAALPSFAQAGATVEALDEVFPSPRKAFEDLYWASQGARLGDFTAEQQAVMDPGQVAFARHGQDVSVRELFHAGMVRDELSRRMMAFHQTYDLLLTPQVGVKPFEAGANWPLDSGMDNWFDWAGFLYPFNFTRQPAASFPCGFTADGLPVGLQIVARFGADDKVLRAARALERVKPIALPRVS